MHAVVTKVSFTDVDTATTNLRERTAPAVSQLPGFVAGYFTRLGDDDGLSMVVFDSEDNAKSASETVASRMFRDTGLLPNPQLVDGWLAVRVQREVTRAAR